MINAFVRSTKWSRWIGAALVLGAPLAGTAPAAEEPPSFEGEKTTWHEGFERHDFLMDEETLAITPFHAPDGERFGVSAAPAGRWRCVVVVPKAPAPGNPWSWRGCYWDHQPQTEIALLERGFHVAFVSSAPGKAWDAWYAFLTEQHGLSSKPAFIGMSRGGEYAYTWASANPSKVSCIYADNPGGNPEMLERLGGLAKNDVPLLHVCGSIDPLLGRYALVIENVYQQFGGRISTMIKEGAAHHPHSLRDPRPIADWIEKSVKEERISAPAFTGEKVIRTSYYDTGNSYREFPGEDTWITCRGPLFTACYDRWQFDLGGVRGTLTVTAPKTPAAGNPWVYRVGFGGRDATVDLALLAKGFHVVTGPVPYDVDGLILKDWNVVYEHLVNHGFSSKPVLEGAGRAAGEAYGWAIENPTKVSCVYAENPVLRSTMSKLTWSENLAALAGAGVPLIHVCGALDPALEGQTRAVERRYKELGGRIFVIVKEGEGHYPLAPKDATAVEKLIVTEAGLGSKTE